MLAVPLASAVAAAPAWQVADALELPARAEADLPAVMDAAKQAAISACGTCGYDERAHQHAAGTDEEAIAVLVALGGPCARFTVSAAALAYQKHLAMAARQPRPGGRRGPICGRCGNRGHARESCPF